MNSFSKSDKLKEFRATKMTNLITFLDKNIKFAIYTGGGINLLCPYIDIIGDPDTFTNSVQSSFHFGPSHSTNNDTVTL